MHSTGFLLLTLWPSPVSLSFVFFFFNDTATTEIYTLSLHDALPIFRHPVAHALLPRQLRAPPTGQGALRRSEEHTSELQSRQYLVCRLLLEKKKNHLDYTAMPYDRPRATTQIVNHASVCAVIVRVLA